ncbi:hypothetical protein DPMN_069932 [Dreissena polymorpha]|uniref:G-protein coupled receptors family 1 profile domain-containing protein n=1 Tax=Dreissena polymorpha TaxID=45954 RepID=A0A9D4BUS1_DREPO|nr:hypothetical protein DPMN_069932 [Dreissena polymorpha]
MDPTPTNSSAIQQMENSTATNTSYGIVSTLDDSKEFYEHPENVVVLLVSVCGIIANVCSILATVHIPRDKWTTYNKLIINLAVSDILVVTNVCVNHISVTLMDNSVCLGMLSTVLFNIGLTSTLFNLLLMAVDHFLAIMYALRYDYLMSNFRSNVVIIFVWIISVLVSLLELFVVFADINVKFDSDICINIHANSKMNYEFVIVIFIFVAMTALLVIYTIICIQVRRIVRQDRLCKRTESHSYKAVKTTFLIIGTFALCWCPLGTYHLWIFFVNEDVLTKVSTEMIFRVNAILLAFMLSNTIWDPLIYAKRRSEVQFGYRRLFTKLFCRKWSTVNARGTRRIRARFMSDTIQMTDETVHLDNYLLKRDSVSVNSQLSTQRSRSSHSGSVIFSMEERSTRRVCSCAKAVNSEV